MASRDLGDADPRLVDAFRQAEAEYEADHPGHQVMVICTYRSPTEQWETFKLGRHQDPMGAWVADDPVGHRGIVTECDGRTRLSEHNHSPARAIDFAIVINGKLHWEVLGEYRAFGAAAVAAGLEYGGNWLGWKDWDHVQLPAGGGAA